MLKSILKNFFISRWLVKSYFSKEDLKALEEKIIDSEKQHSAEIRIVIEANRDLQDIILKRSIRERAIEVFSHLRVWDTEQNNGILIYLLLSEHIIEIIADRAIYKTLGHKYWDDLNHKLVEYFQKKEYQQGMTYVIDAVSAKLVTLFPVDGSRENIDELPNTVVIL